MTSVAQDVVPCPVGPVPRKQDVRILGSVEGADRLPRIPIDGQSRVCRHAVTAIGLCHMRHFGLRCSQGRGVPGPPPPCRLPNCAACPGPTGAGPAVDRGGSAPQGECLAPAVLGSPEYPAGAATTRPGRLKGADMPASLSAGCRACGDGRRRAAASSPGHFPAGFMMHTGPPLRVRRRARRTGGALGNARNDAERASMKQKDGLLGRGSTLGCSTSKADDV
jgi:hypothetical protein